MAERQVANQISNIRADHVARYKFAAKRIRGDVLDAACGCGYGSAILAEHAKMVLGVDRDQGAIEYARRHWRRTNALYQVADVTRIEPGRYYWAVSFETIEHLEDDLGFLRMLRECSRRLVLSAPNEQGLPFSPERFPYHVRHYTAAEMVDRLSRAGWSCDGIWGQRGPYSDVTTVEQAGGRATAQTLVYEAN